MAETAPAEVATFNCTAYDGALLRIEDRDLTLLMEDGSFEVVWEELPGDATGGARPPHPPAGAMGGGGFCGGRGRASPAVAEKVLKVLSGLEPSIPSHRVVPDERRTL